MRLQAERCSRRVVEVLPGLSHSDQHAAAGAHRGGQSRRSRGQSRLMQPRDRASLVWPEQLGNRWFMGRRQV